ncbi:MAG: aldo/keto reductase [Acidimicrobiia bacterium]|nr:aldo/keto reductase [Acidimicrobiia bacterium]
MQTRTLGPNGPEVSAIGLGCMSMSQSYGIADPDEAEATLLRALEVGVTFFDTANAYGNGHNEELVGRVLGAHRDRIVLATKFGIIREKPGVDGHPDNVAGYCDGSLARLGMDFIDLYYLHRVDKRVPIEDTVGAMGELVRAGKVGAIGLSEVSSATLRRAHAVHPITAVQSEYSLWTRDVERKLIGTCAELGVALVPFSPLGRGFFTGAVVDNTNFGKGDMRKNFPRFQGENFERNQRLLDGVKAVAAEVGATPGQVALGWLGAKGPHIVPIPGTKRVARVEENAGAGDVTLTAAQVATLDELFDPANIAGERYPAEMFRTIETDEP